MAGRFGTYVPHLARGYCRRDRWCIGIAALFTLIPLSACRSRAYQDVYNDQLTSEVRILEDQLYEADYQNQVLQQKLERERRKQLSEKTPANSRAPLSSSSNGSKARASEPGKVDSATPTVPSEFDVDLGTPDDDLPAPFMLPRVQVLPPRVEEFSPPQIEEGEPAPPGGEATDAPLPPGQIPTPESARLLLPIEPTYPVSVEIHPGLSGGHHQDSDNEIDGLYLVVTLKDNLGKISHFDKPISIVLLDPDPSKTGEAARIGRWNFTAQQVAEHFRETPLPSFHFPILWNDRIPQGNEVAVFVRVMTNSETPIETDMMLRFRTSTTADWQPSGLGTRSAGLDPATVWR